MLLLLLLLLLLFQSYLVVVMLWVLEHLILWEAHHLEFIGPHNLSDHTSDHFLSLLLTRVSRFILFRAISAGSSMHLYIKHRDWERHVLILLCYVLRRYLSSCLTAGYRMNLGVEYQMIRSLNFLSETVAF